MQVPSLYYLGCVAATRCLQQAFKVLPGAVFEDVLKFAELIRSHIQRAVLFDRVPVSALTPRLVVGMRLHTMEYMMRNAREW